MTGLRPMPARVIHVGVHPSQWPDQVRADLHESLRSRRVNPKFHYESRKQARHWLQLHEAFSPARRDADCQATYDRAFRALAQTLGSAPFQLVGLGCGGGQKERRLLELTAGTGVNSAFLAVDVSWSLALIARNEVAQILPESSCHTLVCDLGKAADLRADLDARTPPGYTRVLTCFGVLPNFIPNRLITQIAALLRPDDRLLLSANLARESDYDAHLGQILPQYDNSLTREWLFLLLDDLGIEQDDGRWECRVEPDAAWKPLARITIDFVFVRPRSLILDDAEYRFERDDRLHLFFSYRHTVASVRGLLAQQGIITEAEWITASSEEGIFACRRTSSVAACVSSL
jgi:SAM-dependent methyltransferase